MSWSAVVVFAFVFASMVIREGSISERKKRVTPLGLLLRKLWEAYPGNPDNQQKE